MDVVYFSNVSENTHRFVQRVGCPAIRLPLHRLEPTPLVTKPYVLMLPSYGGGHGGGSVPKQVIKFLNIEGNRDLLTGVIASGNLSFGTTYCRAGDIVSWKCGVPVLYQFELLGTDRDVTRVRQILEEMESK